MSSFYGGGGGSGSSSEAVRTLTGTSTSPIVLNTLDEGNYVIEGYYIYTSEDTELKTQDGGLSLMITTDSVSGEKIGKFESYSGGTFYINILTFDNLEGYDLDVLPIEGAGSGGSSENVRFYADTLPTTGEANVLYVTNESVFRYIDGDYVDLAQAEPLWGEF